MQKLAARLRNISGSSTKKVPNEVDVGDGSMKPQVPNAANFGFKSCNQIWDVAKGEWTEIYRLGKTENIPVSNRVMAYNRVYGAQSFENHIWIEIRDESLLELLKPNFRGFGGFTGVVPGIDARHIYLQRDKLKKCIPQPAELQALATADQVKYNDLERILDYVEKEFADATLELKYMQQEEDPQIKWDLLWTLFAPGELLETQEPASGFGMAFRPKTWFYSDSSSNSRGHDAFEVQGEYIEWTGDKYATIRLQREIKRYTGTKSIHTLAFKRLTPERKLYFTERGRKYTEHAGTYHLNYETHVIWKDFDFGRRGVDVITRTERADGRVMIDVGSFRRYNPDWDRWDSDDPYGYSQQEQNTPDLDQKLENLELYLLPPTLCGWSFVVKKWGQFSVEKLSPISFQQNAFEDLVLREDNKKLLKSLVEEQTSQEEDALFRDMIPGKGRGLVMLLHGNPGTGKTLTAEAISEHLKLPLYNVSCSEFGIDLSEVEARLKQILQIASLWKAIVLIDEADIFLEARSDDLQRSSIVGVFLRELEYQSGIVILTTNRVRKIDEAFKSRIGIALKYKDFDLESRKLLWNKFLSFAGATVENPDKPSLKCDFSQKDITTLSMRQTNGRVIAHVVRSARALARSAKEPLDIRYVQRVWEIHDEFEADFQASLQEPVLASSLNESRISNGLE